VASASRARLKAHSSGAGRKPTSDPRRPEKRSSVRPLGAQAARLEEREELAARVAVARLHLLVVGAPEDAQGRHPDEEQPAGPQNACHLPDGGAVVPDPLVVEDVEGGHDVERAPGEGQRRQGRPHRPDASRPAEVEGLGGEVDPHRPAEPREMHEVPTGAAARVEDAQGARPVGEAGESRLEEGMGDRPLSGVPPLGVLRLEHPAVLGRLHRRVSSDVK
jgi:hypothetical protein